MNLRNIPPEKKDLDLLEDVSSKNNKPTLYVEYISGTHSGLKYTNYGTWVNC